MQLQPHLCHPVVLLFVVNLSVVFSRVILGENRQSSDDSRWTIPFRNGRGPPGTWTSAMASRRVGRGMA